MLVMSLRKQDYRYTTWYEFKRDLEKCLGYHLTNREWLRVKPRSPLPWSYYHLKRSFGQVRLIKNIPYIRGFRA